MSSLAVREAFETRWPVAMPTLSLDDTINLEPDRDALPAQWATVDYFGTSDNQVSLGDPACWREEGTILVTVFVASGTGSVNVVNLADQVRNQFRNWDDPSIGLEIFRAEPPEGDAASDGRWFAMSVSLVYTYDRFI